MYVYRGIVDMVRFLVVVSLGPCLTNYTAHTKMI